MPDTPDVRACGREAAAMVQGWERGTRDAGPGGDEGPARRPAGRLRRGLLALLVAAAVAVPLAGA
ncbi:hypothetical protein ACTHS2_37170, partial [Streptomyces pseudogriseolus]